MFHRDYLTVRNITRAMMHRAIEPHPVIRFQWIEPVTGLLHLQMNVGICLWWSRRAYERVHAMEWQVDGGGVVRL